MKNKYSKKHAKTMLHRFDILSLNTGNEKSPDSCNRQPHNAITKFMKCRVLTDTWETYHSYAMSPIMR